MYAVIILTYHSGGNHNVAMVKICKVYMDDDNVAMIMHGHSTSNKMHPSLQPFKKD